MASNKPLITFADKATANFSKDLPKVMAEFDGKLIAGGYFTEAGGDEAHRIASWDGGVPHIGMVN